MAKRTVVTWPDEVLRTPGDDVPDMTGEVAKLIDDMFETMHASRGIGLAAQQVGVTLRVIVVDVPREEGGRGPLALANPRVVETHGHTSIEEGCLSFPGLTVEVPRAASVLVRGIDRDGREIDVEADGLFAVCLQHEIDHVDGITFVDRLAPLARRVALRTYFDNLRAHAPAERVVLPI